MQTLAAHINIDDLLDLIGDLEKMERQANRNLNVQIALETILLRVRQLLTPPDPVDRSR
jgi:DNA polymerase-3 subunit delta'